MAEPITIKKKKKLKIKSKSAVATAAPDGGDPASDASSPTASEPLPGVFGRPADAEVVKAPSYTVYVIFAVLALLMFIAIISLQAIEWSFLNPAFPHPIQTGPVVVP